MKQHTTLLTIGLGCVLLATSGCAAYRDATNSAGCSIGYLAGGITSSFAPNLLGCAIGVTVEYTLGAIEKQIRGTRNDYAPITSDTPAQPEPTVVRWDVTYAPLPTPGDTPTQPDNSVPPNADSSLLTKPDNPPLTIPESHDMTAPEARDSAPAQPGKNTLPQAEHATPSTS